MNSLPSWSRSLILALLCALVCAPGALRARICLVGLGVVESSSCCSEQACCTDAPDSGPTLNADDGSCDCCVDVVLDSHDRKPSPAPAHAGEIAAAPLWMVSMVFAAPAPPFTPERGQYLHARERMRPSAAALLPLRI